MHSSLSQHDVLTKYAPDHLYQAGNDVVQVNVYHVEHLPATGQLPHRLHLLRRA